MPRDLVDQQGNTNRVVPRRVLPASRKSTKMHRLWKRHRHKTEIEEYHRLEIEEIFERTRALRSLRAQIGTFNATTSITVVGVALSTQRAGLFFIAALSLAILIAVDIYIRHHVEACYIRGVQLEDKYASDADRAILHTDAVLIKEKAWVRRQSFGGFWLPLVFIPIELAAGLLLWLLAGWSLF